jgi:hypothetical protein
MNIQDALKESGRVVFNGDGSIAIDKNGILHWEYNYPNNPVCVNTILLETWQPFRPEPKCPACIEADRLFGDKQCNEAMHREYAREADHLRKYHCTCKEDN